MAAPKKSTAKSAAKKPVIIDEEPPAPEPKPDTIKTLLDLRPAILEAAKGVSDDALRITLHGVVGVINTVEDNIQTNERLVR